TDEPGKYPPDAGFAKGVTIRNRDELDAVQRELREIAGLTVLVYDQTCAAEKRRRRKRGTFPDPAKRVFINDAVCEGCGDCSDKSNCVSVKPLETELGRKRQIDQSNCNKDFSCVNGFCPSFVSVHGGTPAKAKRPQLKLVQDDPFATLPPPAMRPLSEAYGILVTGIGGTGVITVGALIGMAAHLEGRGCTVLDFTGLATAILGDSIATNLFMLGYAWQKGLVPLSLAALERAIGLNGVAVETSKRTFACGRLAAHNLGAVQAAAKPTFRVEKTIART